MFAVFIFSLISYASALQLCEVTDTCFLIGVRGQGSLVWNDQGSGANRDFSCYKSSQTGTKGLKSVGHHAQGHYYGLISPVHAMGANLSRDRHAIVSPVNFQFIWNDGGSGASLDGAIWRPICPWGYSSLGDVMHRGYTNGPPASLYKEVGCVRNSYLEACDIGHIIWNDRGSGANRDVEVYSINCPPGVVSEYFLASPRYGAKPTATPVGINMRYYKEVTDIQ